MAGLCETWLNKIQLALDKKRTEFEQFAEECAKFYDGPATYMWDEEKAHAKQGGWLDSTPFPNFKMQLNKAFEAVSLYGPALFHQYPNVQVNPVRRPELLPEAMGVDLSNPLAMEMYQQSQAQSQMEMGVRQTHANIAATYLNAVQRITDKKTQARSGITEGLVRGLGVLHTKIYEPRGSPIRYPRSEYISECDFVKDSDATRAEDVQWQAVRCIAPKNIVAERYGLQEEDLKGHFQSHDSQSTKKGKKDAKSGTADNTSFDLVEYWEIYSKNGFGDKLKSKHDAQPDYSLFGPYCYLVVAKGVPFPLNLPPWVLPGGEAEEPAEQVFDRVQWPIPFWTPPLCDWPVSELGFYFKGLWPVPLFKPLIGPIKFVNWCLSFLADKCAAAGTDYLVYRKKAGQTLRDQIINGVGPFKGLEIEDAIAADQPLDKLVTILSAPDFKEGMWKMVSESIALIDRLSGLTELLAGMTTTQMRSAEEAAVKQANTQIRPDDMAQRVEDWLTLAAKKEMLAAQWVLEAQDIAAVVGDQAATVWEQQMATRDFASIISDFEYTIEAGSARKPNVHNKRQALNEFAQSNGKLMEAMAMGGAPQMLNAYLKAWGDVNQIDVSQFMVPEPDPNAPPPPDPEMVKAETDIQVEQAKLGMDEQRMQMDLFGKLAELQMKGAEHQQEMQHENRMANVELSNAKKKSTQDLAIQKQKGQAQVQAAKAKARAKPSTNGSKS